MLKNFCKATRFYFDSHDCNSNCKCILQEGWLASPKGFTGVAGRPFSAHLPPVSEIIFIMFKLIYKTGGIEHDY